MHLVFYDGECGFCDSWVQRILRWDKKKEFVFAPLQGKTAEEFLKDLPPAYKQMDTLILVENYKSPNPTIHVLGKAVLRIFWLLGWPWMVLGVFSFQPSFLYNWVYRIVANNRNFFSFKKDCPIPNRNRKDRFLP